MDRFSRRAIARVFLLLTGLLASPCLGRFAAAERTAAELLPPTTVLYFEVAEPDKLLDVVLDHPLLDRVNSMEVVKAAKQQKQYLDFKAGVAILESQLGMPWPKIIHASASQGMVFAMDAPTQGVALLMQGEDAASQTKLVDVIVNLANQDAAAKGNAGAKSGEYRSIRVHQFDQARVAAFDRWLLVANKPALGKEILDRWLDDSGKSLAEQPQYQASRASAPAPATLFGYVNTEVLRQAGVAKQLFADQAENPAAELILGGILNTLHRTPHVTVTANVALDTVELSAVSPHDRGWASEAREHFFGPQGQGVAPAALLPDSSLFTLAAYRDISSMWLRAGDLFNEKTNEELAKADSNLTTLFAGKDFGEDILGALKPQVQVVVTRQEFADDKPTPAVKLPAFALVGELKDPEKMRPELRRTFQSLVGFLNIVGAMNGQPQLDQIMERIEDGEIVTAHYLPNANTKDPLGLKIYYNFSPTVAFSGSRFVIGSTEQIARQLVVIPSPVPAGNDDRVINTNARLQLSMLSDILSDNKSQLVAQNMLEKGHTKEEADREVQTLLDVISWFDQASLKLDTSDHDLRLSLKIEVRP